MKEPPTLFVKNYEVDPILFQQGYPKGCGPYLCNAACCSDGVWVDLKEKEKILREKELVKKYMDETQDKNENSWFAEYQEDDDFPSGVCIGTTVQGNGCVFLNKEGLCVLQVAASAERKDKWNLKPFYCVLFPISIAENILTFDEHKQDENTSCCSIHQTFEIPLYKVCKDEIIYAIGEDGYRQIDEYYQKYKAYFKQVEVNSDSI